MCFDGWIVGFIIGLIVGSIGGVIGMGMMNASSDVPTDYEE